MNGSMWLRDSFEYIDKMHTERFCQLEKALLRTVLTFYSSLSRFTDRSNDNINIAELSKLTKSQAWPSLVIYGSTEAYKVLQDNLYVQEYNTPRLSEIVRLSAL